MSAEHQGQVEKILKELGKRIDDLIVEARGAKDEIRDEVEDKIRDLKSKKENLETEYSEFKEKNEGKWVEIKNHLSSAADEIKLAAEAAFKKKG
ncbi:hypothetical protein KO507_08680 [Gilvimarinus agarilyticus]|uniref:Uncharacterized protein n=1 Tax=Reichenbachiella agariperforans TaxID=156994 RepID=A0A1M6W3P4_REIAG|nr:MULTISPECIES: hypothetical protein [Reichenbachiella]MBU2885834.1 hypothetical protein [Gilvimarinus agarilyticus]MBU2915216.1 hypothetical protein [Reichenbachiella agariperforans]RJE70880.1 hypothetical protein BGP76_08845 [Reichenbachiella sp. MSK19-1]SHK88226.1 hypothetical protein SAMN04488028_110108 [Reichenbachiella agariperforans]